MLRLLRLLLVLLIRSARSRRDLLLENLTLRRQLGVLKQRHPPPRFTVSDKLFRVMLGRLLAGMEARVDPRATRDHYSMASGWIQAPLDVAFAASAPCGNLLRPLQAQLRYTDHLTGTTDRAVQKSNLSRGYWYKRGRAVRPSVAQVWSFDKHERKHRTREALCTR
jgi:hypothetical protein